MTGQQNRPQQARWHPSRSLFAWAVHAYTATGAVLAFVAVLAILDRQYKEAFFLMVAATVVDATDGMLARLAEVTHTIPAFDGARLDDVVDYLTFVFVPILLLYRAGDLPQGWGMASVVAVLLSSAYGFGASDAKTDDHFFTGFPSYWNIVALYLHAGGLRPEANAAILFLLSALVFVRIGYVYPTRTPQLRVLTMALCLMWAVMMVLMILKLPDVPRPFLVGSLFFPVYYIVLSLVLHARRGRS